MKKTLKIILILVLLFLLLITIDLICIFTFNKPLFAIKENNQVYRGILYDTYNCQEYPMSQIKFKGNKFLCRALINTYYLNNSSKYYELDSYIKLKEKTTLTITNIKRKDNNEKIIIKDIQAKLFLNQDMITEYKKEELTMIIAEGENSEDWVALVELDKILKNISLNYESDLTIKEYKNKDLYLDIKYITKDNESIEERIKLFFQ